MYQWSDGALTWLTALVWGEIYVKGLSPLGLWNGTNIRLFHVKHAQPPPSQITNAVSNVVGGILGRGDAPRRVQRP